MDYTLVSQKPGDVFAEIEQYETLIDEGIPYEIEFHTEEIQRLEKSDLKPAETQEERDALITDAQQAVDIGLRAINATQPSEDALKKQKERESHLDNLKKTPLKPAETQQDRNRQIGQMKSRIALFEEQKRLLAARVERLTKIAEQDQLEHLIIPASAERHELKEFKRIVSERLNDRTTLPEESSFLTDLHEKLETLIDAPKETAQDLLLPFLPSEKEYIINLKLDELKVQTLEKGPGLSMSYIETLKDFYNQLKDIESPLSELKSNEVDALRQMRANIEGIILEAKTPITNDSIKKFEREINKSLENLDLSLTSKVFKQIINTLLKIIHLPPLFKTTDAIQKTMDAFSRLESSLKNIEKTQETSTVLTETTNPLAETITPAATKP